MRSSARWVVWVAVFVTGATVTSPASGQDAPVPTRTFQRTPDGGSGLPCAVPLRWRVTRVDAEFRVDRNDATALVRGAAELWNEAFGVELLREDPVDGFPVRLVYDGRQASERRRAEALRRHRARGEEITRRGELLTAQAEAWEVARGEWERDMSAHEERLARHNDRVRIADEDPATDGDLRRELRLRSRALRDEREALDGRRRRLNSEARQIESATSSHNRRVERQETESRELARRYPPAAVESGAYRERARFREGRLISLRREIRIFRFSDPVDLVLVAAHEFGHALGLGHATVPEAVMAAEQVRGPETGAEVRLHPDDVARFAALCPEVVGQP